MNSFFKELFTALSQATYSPVGYFENMSIDELDEWRAVVDKANKAQIARFKSMRR